MGVSEIDHVTVARRVSPRASPPIHEHDRRPPRPRDRTRDVLTDTARHSILAIVRHLSNNPNMPYNRQCGRKKRDA